METRSSAVHQVLRDPGKSTSQSFNFQTEGKGMRNANALVGSPRFYSPTSQNLSPFSVQGKGKRQYANDKDFNRGRGHGKQWVPSVHTNNTQFHQFPVRHPVRNFESPSRANFFRSGTWIQVPTPEGKWYYYHEQTRETTWNQPVGDGVSICLSPEFYEMNYAPKKEITPKKNIQAQMKPDGEMPLPAFVPMPMPIFPILPHDIANMPSPLPVPFPIYPFPPPPWHVPFNLPSSPLLQEMNPPPCVPPPVAATLVLKPVSPLKPLKQELIRVPSLGKKGYCNPDTLSRENLNQQTKPNAKSSAVAGMSNADADVYVIWDANADRATSVQEPKKPLPSNNVNSDNPMTPVFCRAVKGTRWCIVLTNDNRIFYYDSSSKKSDWKRPSALMKSAEVDDFIKKIKSGELDVSKLKSQKDEKKGKRAPSPSELEVEEICTQTNNIDSNSTPVTKTAINKSSNVCKGKSTSIKINIKERPEDKITTLKSSEPKEATNTDDEKLSENTQTTKSDVPLHERIQIFRNLLTEKKVSGFSRWEKELHKIVFDPRYRLLDSEMRKIVYQSFVAEEVAAKRRRERDQQSFLEEEFCTFVKNVLSKDATLTFEEFETTYKKDTNMQLVENVSKRKQMFKKQYKVALKQKKREKDKDKTINKKKHDSTKNRDTHKDEYTKRKIKKKHRKSSKTKNCYDDKGRRSDGEIISDSD